MAAAPPVRFQSTFLIIFNPFLIFKTKKALIVLNKINQGPFVSLFIINILSLIKKRRNTPTKIGVLRQ